MVKVLGVNDGGPVAGELEVGDGFGGEDKVLGGNLVAVAPPDAGLEGEFGGPEGLPVNRLFLQGGGKIGGQARHPVKALVGVGVEGELAAQDVAVPDAGVGAEVGPVVGGGQVFGDADLVNALNGVGNGRPQWAAAEPG